MPVTKHNTKKTSAANNGGWSHEFVRKLFVTLAGILLVYITVWVATLIRNNLKAYDTIGFAQRQAQTITIEARGKATARPNIAVTTIGMISEGGTVAEAQQKNSGVMNTLLARVGELDVGQEDVQTTAYQIYPLYDYSEEEGRLLRGYEVNQQVTIKIRNLDHASKILTLAGEVGANTVQGLEFTIDDAEVYRAEARTEALQEVARKAAQLAESLGVRISRVISYNEYEQANGPEPRAYALDAGYGGGPEIESGSMDVSLQVSVVFEIE